MMRKRSYQNGPLGSTHRFDECGSVASGEELQELATSGSPTISKTFPWSGHDTGSLPYIGRTTEILEAVEWSKIRSYYDNQNRPCVWKHKYPNHQHLRSKIVKIIGKMIIIVGLILGKYRFQNTISMIFRAMITGVFDNSVVFPMSNSSVIPNYVGIYYISIPVPNDSGK